MPGRANSAVPPCAEGRLGESKIRRDSSCGFSSLSGLVAARPVATNVTALPMSPAAAIIFSLANIIFLSAPFTKAVAALEPISPAAPLPSAK